MATATERRAQILTTIREIEQYGQSYKIGRREYTRPNLKDLYAEYAALEPAAEAEANNTAFPRNYFRGKAVL
jgi:hypothetical protein